MTDHASYLRRGSLTLGAVALGGFGADYLLNVGLSRLLSAHDYGDYKVAHAFAALAGAAVLLGGDRAAPKALAGPLSRKETAFAWEYLRFYLRLGLVLSGVVAIVTWAGSLLHAGHARALDHHPLAWVVAGIPILAAGAMISRALQSARRLALASVPWRVAFPVGQLAIIGAVAWAAGGVSEQQAIVLSLVAAAIVVTWQWRALRRRELPELVRAPEAAAPRTWLANSTPMMGAFLVTLALAQSDLYFLEILGEEHEVGRLAAAATVAHFLLVVQATVVALVAPLAQPALEQGAAASLRVYSQGQRLMVTALVPAAGLLILGASPALALFGSGYGEVTLELRLLVIGNLAWAAAALSVLWLQYADRGRLVVGVSVATLVVDSGLDVLLIPRFGVLGAAASTALTMGIAAVVLVAARRRATGIGA